MKRCVLISWMGASLSLFSAERQIPNLFVGCNFEMLNAAGQLDSPRLREAVESLPVSFLRIPGGKCSEYWSWERGGLMEFRRTSRPKGIPWRKRRVTDLKIPATADFFSATGKSPLIVLNVFTSDLKSEINHLKQMQQCGLKINMVELGNEPYSNRKTFRNKYKDVESFGKEMRTWIRALKNEFPDVRIGFPGPLSSNNTPNAEQLAELKRTGALAAVDAVSFHPSPYYRNYGTTNARSAERAAERILKEINAFLNTEELKVLPRNTEIWVSDFHINEPRKTMRLGGTWLQGLINISAALLCLEDSRITVYTQHTLLGKPQWQLLVGVSQNALSYTAENKVEPAFAARFSKTPSGRALYYLSSLLAENRTVEINFPQKGIITAYFRNEKNECSLLALNTTAEAYTIPEVKSSFRTFIILQPKSNDPWSCPLNDDQLQQKTTEEPVIPPFTILTSSLSVKTDDNLNNNE